MTPITTARGGAAIALLLFTTVGLAQHPQPAGDEQTRWWTHVKTLADDSLEGRQTGSDGYRKAVAYVVAEQFERAGLKPAGTQGYLQTWPFMRRRIVEAQSHVALVRGGEGETCSGLARTSRSTCGRSWRPRSTRRWCSPATDFRRRTPGTTIWQASISRARSPSSSPERRRAITGAAAAHYQKAGVRWQRAQSRWRDRRTRDPQPEDDGAAVGADGAEPPESGDDARRPALQRSRGNEVLAPTSTRRAPSGCSRDPAARSRICSRSRPTRKAAAALRAAGDRCARA